MLISIFVVLINNPVFPLGQNSNSLPWLSRCMILPGIKRLHMIINGHRKHVIKSIRHCTMQVEKLIRTE